MKASAMLLLLALLAASSLSAVADESPLVEFRSLSPDTALEMAQAARENCREG